MKILALTGGIASGKSTVGKMFSELGTVVIDADLTAHRLYDKGTPLYQELVGRYGPSILGVDNEVDRKELGKIIFQDSKEKHWLESKTHPATRQRIDEIIQKEKNNNPPLILIEAALHVETRYHQAFDGLMVVHANPETQIKRLMDRDGMSRQEATLRLQGQMPALEKRKHADWVIENDGSLKDTQKQVRELFEEFTR